MTIQIRYDARSDISNVVSVQADLNGKKKYTQLGSIQAKDRYRYNRKASQNFSSSKDLDDLAEAEDLQTNVALNELFRFYELILHRTYEYVPNVKHMNVAFSDEDQAKIEREIEKLTAKWQEALKNAFEHKFKRAYAQDVLDKMQIVKDL